MERLATTSFKIILPLLLWPKSLTPEVPSRWILWNVGQGQFLTLSEFHQCLHFDMGGETVPWDLVSRECRNKINHLYISHWDWDHISFIKKFRRQFPQMCLARRPGGTTRSPQKKASLANLAICQTMDAKVFEFNWHAIRFKNANDASRVFIHQTHHWLIPGDSTKAQEKIWAPTYRAKLQNIKFLVVGHHGSRTSTSAALLESLPQLKVALVSARKKRYGHPHHLIMRRLRQKKIPILQTEIWGHIIVPVKK